MTDEKFVYTQDVREKKNIARSARNTRTHCGKGGAVKFPSDYKTQKELKEMSGECKSYRLNSPMKWDEFKSMPDDLKIMYIKALKQKWNVPTRYIAKMMGCSESSIYTEITRIGIATGKSNKGQKRNWDKEGFLAWCNGAPLPACSAESVEASFKEDVEKGLASLEAIAEPVPVPVPEIKTLPVREEKRHIVPNSGTMTIEGRLEDVLNTVSVLLGGAKANLCISWEVLPEDGVCEHG